MRSTFYGFEIAKSGIQAAQAGLDVTGTNMANVATEGYSRQVVSQSANCSNSYSYKIAQKSKMLVGMGVTVNGIKQIRDDFLDVRFRNASADNGALSKSVSILTDIENILDETQTDGLGVMLREFAYNLQTLSLNAGDIEISGLVRSSAQKVAETLNQYAAQLDTIVEQETYDMTVTVKSVNTLLNKIADLNATIKTEKLQDNPVNEINDTRNVYLDQLSAALNITVESHTDGTVSVKTGDTYLLDAAAGTVLELSVNAAADGVSLADGGGNEIEISGGSLYGVMEAINGKGSYASAGESDFKGVMYYKSALNDFAASLADTFNTLNGPGKPLFEGLSAEDIAISKEWLEDANYITASETGGNSGANDNILKMIAALDSEIDISPYFTGRFREFVLSLMSDVSIDLNYKKDMLSISELVLTSVANQRESVMGVSLNEETVNLLTYQKAFEASSRFMTVLDEALDIVINRMGIVGR